MSSCLVITLRLWSLDPVYLDWKGLGGVWREGLLAQAVLLNRTKGWKNHSQLSRFKSHGYPILAIGFYLLKIYEEGCRRGYHYDKSRIIKIVDRVEPIKVTKGQLLFELEILKERLRERDTMKFRELELETSRCYPRPHPIFEVVDGEVEPWEKTYWRKKRKES